jgi:hypothetical protein
MSAAEMPAGAAPERTPDWHSIDWKKVWCTVRRLQARIVKAIAEGRWNEAIYERGSVKRGGADFVIGSSRTSPFAVGFGRSGPSRPAGGRSGCASRSHPLSLRSREFLPRLIVFDAAADVT